MNSTIEDHCRRLATMKSERGTWESHWREIERRVNPRGEQFSRQSPGSRRTDLIFDSTATLALEKFAPAMVSLTCPREQVWHRLAPRKRALARSLPVRRYLEEVNGALWEYRYAASAGFQTQLHETMIGLGSLGTSPLWIEDNVKTGGIVYRAHHISEVWIDIDAAGMVDTVAREFEYTPRQAIEKFGEPALTKDVIDAAKSQPGRKFMFTHFITPRLTRDPQRIDGKNMPIGSWYWMSDSKHLVREGGFMSFPMPTVRYTTAPRENYGRSVAMMALADIKMLNEMKKSMLAAVHKALNPPLLLPDDGVMSRFQTKPGALNYGGVNMRGEQMVRELGTNAQLPAGFEMIEQTREVVKEAFLVTLFQALAQGGDRMTATEVMERVREKGVLLAPAAARIESELLGPMIEREIDILARAGLLPDMPDELMEAGGEIAIEYDNPISRAARMEQPTAFLRTMEALTPLTAIDPTVMDGLDLPRAARGIAEILGVPAAWQRSDEDIEMLQQQRKGEQQVQQLVDAIPKVAGAQLDLARAAEAGGGSAIAA